MGEFIAYTLLFLFLMAFVPAIVASYKKRSFSKWYIYGVLLLPIAFIHSLLIKKSESFINVYFTDLKSAFGQSKKKYKFISPKGEKKKPDFSYVCSVFLTKLVFSAFSALALFALFRLFCNDTSLLRFSCIAFSLGFSVLLSVVQIYSLSHFPIIADEITKRAFIMIFASVVSSLPIFAFKNIVMDALFPNHLILWMFISMCISFVLFLWLLLKIQSYYYSIFARFFDYSLLSIAAYAVFAAITLIGQSLGSYQKIVYALSLQLQLFNSGYLAGLEYLEKISSIYSSALVHLFIVIVLLVSDFSCYNFKKKEVRSRIEYRTNAFRMSQRKVLRRHIPREGIHIKPINI